MHAYFPGSRATKKGSVTVFLAEHIEHHMLCKSHVRQVAFMTEMGLYYSYFKDAVDPNVGYFEAVNGYLYDDTVEYPSVVNALKVSNQSYRRMLPFAV